MNPRQDSTAILLSTLNSVVIGLCFPIGAIIWLLLSSDLTPTQVNVLDLHRHKPLLWVIWSAPLILGIFGYLLGRSYQALNFRMQQATRHKTEMQTIFDSVACAIITIDHHGIISNFNKAAETMFGCSTADAVGTNIKRFMPQKVAALHNLYIKHFLETQQSPVIGLRREVEAKRQNGELFPAILQVSMIESQGKVLFVGILDDISIQKTMQYQLYQAQKMEAIGHLAAGVAHEINTPIQFIGDNLNALGENFKDLTNFFSGAEKLLAETSDETQQQWHGLFTDLDVQFILQDSPEAIQQSLDGIHKVSEIVAAMKIFSHADTQQVSLVDMNDLISKALTICKNEYKYVADIETDLDPNLPKLECYANEINQVLINLLINAADAIKEKSEGHGLIKIKTEINDAGILICLQDNGAGIPEHVQDKVFNLFFTTKEIGKGTGQGLSLAYKVVAEKHQGRIWFESKRNEGTKFYIELPLILGSA